METIKTGIRVDASWPALGSPKAKGVKSRTVSGSISCSSLLEPGCGTAMKTGDWEEVFLPERCWRDV